MTSKKKRGPYNLHTPRDFGGRGAMKCRMCGEPIAKHKTMDRCEGKKKT